VRVALASDADWEQAIGDARGRGADVVCLPHLSFVPYVAATRDRAGLEHAERAPSPTFARALALAGGSWLAASAYESEGEGVFYVTALVGGPEGPPAASRQRHVEAGHGRYEQMFWSPGHEPPQLAELPWGPTAALVGGDLRAPAAWEQVVDRGARVVLGGASDPAELWAATGRVAAGMAAAHGLTVLVANRSGGQDGLTFAGGGVAFAPDGAPLAPDADGLIDVEAAR
jgi:N-carbamoylputrescine amidase